MSIKNIALAASSLFFVSGFTVEAPAAEANASTIGLENPNPVLHLASANALANTAAAEDTEETGGDRSIRAMDEIVVQGQRTSHTLARTAEKDAENIVSVMTYDEIRKLPIVNSADAVRIIPGVQVETDTGEGRFVNIRGLDSDLNSTTFGGVRLPPTDVTTSPYGGSRAVSFDAIPAEMIGAATVTKTNRPEQEAEALG